MDSLKIKTNETEYEVLIENGLLEKTPELLKAAYPKSRFAVITDVNVYGIYGAKFKAGMEAARADCVFIIVASGEKSKSIATFAEVLSRLAQGGFSRSDVIVALGGGVVGDLAGFTASCYMRGVRYVQIPTTLLAQIDSSVGGKTGVNLPEGKNLAGAFYHPKAVYIDTGVLETLSIDDFSCGMAELIKYALIRDKGMLETLEKNAVDARSPLLPGLIKRCLEIKRDVVAADEKDTGERMLLNFGHTVGHAIEHACAEIGKVISHGQAVAIGMAFITGVSERNGQTEKGTADRIKKTLIKYGLPFSLDGFGRKQIMDGIFVDKKTLAGSLNLILIREPGESFIYPVSRDEIEDYLFKEYK
jgi:3-dehydroquinate synthase